MVGLEIDGRPGHGVERPAVDAGEDVAVTLLDVLDTQEKDAGVPDHVFSGLDGQGLDRESGPGDGAREIGDVIPDREHGPVFQIPGTEASPEIQEFHGEPGLFDFPGLADQPVHGRPDHAEILPDPARAEVLVQADGMEAQPTRPGKDIDHFFPFDPELDRRSVGRPFPGRDDAGVEAAADARVPAHGNPDGLGRELPAPDFAHNLELFGGVDVDGQPVDPENRPEVRPADARPRKENALGREPGLERRLDLAGGNGVDPGAPPLEQPQDAPVGVGFHGIADTGGKRGMAGEGIVELGVSLEDAVLAVDVEGRAVALGQGLRALPGDPKLIVFNREEFRFPPVHVSSPASLLPDRLPSAGKRSRWPARILRTISCKTGYFSRRRSGISTLSPVIMFRIWRALARACPR